MTMNAFEKYFAEQDKSIKIGFRDGVLILEPIESESSENPDVYSYEVKVTKGGRIVSVPGNISFNENHPYYLYFNSIEQLTEYIRCLNGNDIALELQDRKYSSAKRNS